MIFSFAIIFLPTLSSIVNKDVKLATLVSLSKDAFERRTSIGSGLFFIFWTAVLPKILDKSSMIEKTFRNTNLVPLRCFKMKKTSLPIDVHLSKPPLLNKRLI